MMNSTDALKSNLISAENVLCLAEGNSRNANPPASVLQAVSLEVTSTYALNFTYGFDTSAATPTDTCNVVVLLDTEVVD